MMSADMPNPCTDTTHRHVERRDGEVVLASIVEHLVHVVTGHDTSRSNVKNTHIVYTQAMWLRGRFG